MIKEARDYFWKQCSIVNVIYIVLFIFRLKVVSYLQTVLLHLGDMLQGGVWQVEVLAFQGSMLGRGWS